VLRARLATAAVAIPSLLALILYPSPWPLAVFVTVVGVIGLAEYAMMAFPNRRFDAVLTIVLGTAVLLGATSRSPHLLAAALALAVSLGLVWILLTRPDFEPGLRDFGVALVGILYVGLLLPHFIWVHTIGPLGPRWVIFVIVVGMSGDSGGYFIGHAFGRHKLMPRVSPGKTVEGALGIIATSLLGGVASKLVFLRQLPWGETVLLATVMAVLGQLGDLSESMMKRTFGAKESGWLFPGHGGVLDRIDSLLFPVTFLYYHIVFFR